jgi:hypothetical protein
MTREQEDMVIRAYLGVCTLKRCFAKWGTEIEVERTAGLLKDMGEAFPFIPEHVSRMALR